MNENQPDYSSFGPPLGEAKKYSPVPLKIKGYAGEAAEVYHFQAQNPVQAAVLDQLKQIPPDRLPLASEWQYNSPLLETPPTVEFPYYVYTPNPDLIFIADPSHRKDKYARWMMDGTQLLGKGGQGHVYLGVDTKTGENVAIKVIETAKKTPEDLVLEELEAHRIKAKKEYEESQLTSFQRLKRKLRQVLGLNKPPRSTQPAHPEAAGLANAYHPNVLNILESVQIEKDGKPATALIMEYKSPSEGAWLNSFIFGENPGRIKVSPEKNISPDFNWLLSMISQYGQAINDLALRLQVPGDLKLDNSFGDTYGKLTLADWGGGIGTILRMYNSDVAEFTKLFKQEQPEKPLANLNKPAFYKVIMRTPGYTSPEGWRDEIYPTSIIDQQKDGEFVVAIIIFELLTGTRLSVAPDPNDRQSHSQVVDKLLSTEKKATLLKVAQLLGVNGDNLVEIFQKALAAEPENRYANPQEFTTVLVKLLQTATNPTNVAEIYEVIRSGTPKPGASATSKASAA